MSLLKIGVLSSVHHLNLGPLSISVSPLPINLSLLSVMSALQLKPLSIVLGSHSHTRCNPRPRSKPRCRSPAYEAITGPRFDPCAPPECQQVHLLHRTFSVVEHAGRKTIQISNILCTGNFQSKPTLPNSWWRPIQLYLILLSNWPWAYRTAQRPTLERISKRSSDSSLCLFLFFLLFDRSNALTRSIFLRKLCNSGFQIYGKERS
ncbi:hypothetical protein CPB84DRAFT_331687 [Gymnopilus junonius]|uniref:Uncharacterized protein n=1 Tax=Gymnopilus junonius TaxID=109634 RepID=A0A9P5TIA1_GYMJU|nr:hypothetical protein CPB84DRAFT_331687 [Gymnopilus junonius]